MKSKTWALTELPAGSQVPRTSSFHRSRRDARSKLPVEAMATLLPNAEEIEEWETEDATYRIEPLVE